MTGVSALRWAAGLRHGCCGLRRSRGPGARGPRRRGHRGRRPGRRAPAGQADGLRAAGARVLLGEAAQRLPAGTDLVVTSPGWRPDQPLLVAAAAAGIPVWGEVELAWRLRDPNVAWLGVTGTNGKTTTVQMLEAILLASGARAVAAGNVGRPLVEVVTADPPYDVVAVEVSSFQLHWTSTVEFAAAAVLNVAADHIDWHGSFEAYAADKALALARQRDRRGQRRR